MPYPTGNKIAQINLCIEIYIRYRRRSFLNSVLIKKSCILQLFALLFVVSYS